MVSVKTAGVIPVTANSTIWGFVVGAAGAGAVGAA